MIGVRHSGGISKYMNFIIISHLMVHNAKIITFFADKGFLASVRKSVIFQSAQISARVTALTACIGFFSRMLPLVCLEMTSIVG